MENNLDLKEKSEGEEILSEPELDNITENESSDMLAELYTEEASVNTEEAIANTEEATEEATEEVEAEALTEEPIEEESLAEENTAEPEKEKHVKKEKKAEGKEDIPLTVAPVPKFKELKQKKSEKKSEPSSKENRTFFKKLFKKEKSGGFFSFFKTKTWNRIALGLLILSFAIPIGLLAYVIVTYFL